MNEHRTRRVNLGYVKQTALSFLPSLGLCLGLFLFVPIVALLGNGIPSFNDPSFQPPSYLMHPVSYVAELSVPAFGLSALLPFLAESYRYSRKGADCFYSLPLKRRALTCYRHLTMAIGLLLAFSLAFWLFILIYFIAETSTQGLHGVPNYAYYAGLYALSLPLLLLQYGISGAIAKSCCSWLSALISYFTIIATSLGAYYLLIVLPFLDNINTSGPYSMMANYIIMGLSPATPCSLLVNVFNSRIEGTSAVSFALGNYLSLSIYLLAGIAALAYLFLGKGKSGERAGVPSDADSPLLRLGPSYLGFILTAFLTSEGDFYILFLIVFVFGMQYIAYAISEKTFRISRFAWIAIGASMGLGLIYGMPIGLTN